MKTTFIISYAFVLNFFAAVEAHSDHCIYNGQSLALGDRVPLSEKCLWVVCTYRLPSRELLQVHNKDTPSLDIEVSYPGIDCCMDGGEMHEDGANITLSSGAKLSCAKGKWIRSSTSRVNNDVNNTTPVCDTVTNDVNETASVFDRTTYEAQITEEDDKNLPKRILQVMTKDDDKARPGNIVYFFTGQGIDPDSPPKSKFTINQTTGEIFVLKSMNRDPPTGQAQWHFAIFAKDEGGLNIGCAKVEVNIKDVNDNAPLFPHSIYYANVTENGTAGTVVRTMTAVDYDDLEEGINAKLKYSIENNVMDENTGDPIFKIEEETGVIKTAVCCLDREKISDYSIQVVATDGGGLKGTGTVSIHVMDINDMPPTFTKDEWVVEVDETNKNVLPDDPILTVTVHDKDESNKFLYNVIEGSGFGADKFIMISNEDGTGSLKVIQPLDFEDPLQRQGFRFKIKVNDKGEVDDNDKDHVAYSWVTVKLRDINDNKPTFNRRRKSTRMSENAGVGRAVERFRATDPDDGGNSKVTYAIARHSDKQRNFAVSPDGTVTIQRRLNRESSPRHQVKILAIDDGHRQKTATATLIVVVQDVNDNAPRFLENYQPVIPEHSNPGKVVEVLATDDDDSSKGNGPPFTFRMHPNASDMIKRSFKVENDPNGANGDGMAVVSSLRSFDRERQKEYLVPIQIKDSGNPSLSAISKLTIIIGDLNDNRMQPGQKEIFVYNYMGQNTETEIGRVYVFDKDDWDIPDKNFKWKDNKSHPSFYLNAKTGMITMKQGVKGGSYFLEFKVDDRKHTQKDVPANVTVTVKEISHEAVINSGSMRLSGITDEDFISVWNWKTEEVVLSKKQIFREKLAEILNVMSENVDVFSVMKHNEEYDTIDIRFSVGESKYLKPVKLNGLLLRHREDFEQDIGINITMVGIDECLNENSDCEGSCTNSLEISSIPYMVNANRTSLVGVRAILETLCMCSARDFEKAETCDTTPCYNGGQCLQGSEGVRCQCPSGFDGPSCQQTTRTFKRRGYAWYPPLELCENSHLSVEFLTMTPDGVILYNGPIVPPKKEEKLISDFISLELVRGHPRLLLDFGSGTLDLRLNAKTQIDDGNWHRIDIFWDREDVRMVLDHCTSAIVVEHENGSSVEFDDKTCQKMGKIPPFSEYLNVNTPLQLGGMVVEQFDPAHFKWSHTPVGKHFEGCIRNVMHNSQLYDLANPGLSQNSAPGCEFMEELCDSWNNGSSYCGDHGHCAGSLSTPYCECEPRWTGENCSLETTPSTFDSKSFVKYALSFEPDWFITDIQLRFRTREEHGELFRVSNHDNKEYAILEIKDHKLRFRFNLNSLQMEEKDVWLNAVCVDDGEWHVVKAARYGSAAILTLDGGEGRRYNESFLFEGHQMMSVDILEGVYAGGNIKHTGVRTYEVHEDYSKGCIDDIRLEGKQLPLPPQLQGNQWGQVTMTRNVKRNCPSNSSCFSDLC